VRGHLEDVIIEYGLVSVRYFSGPRTDAQEGRINGGEVRSIAHAGQPMDAVLRLVAGGVDDLFHEAHKSAVLGSCDVDGEPEYDLDLAKGFRIRRGFQTFVEVVHHSSTVAWS
jgi:hypothetical protein